MDDINFRAEFHRAMSPIVPPAPWLAAAVRDRLLAREGRERSFRRPLRLETPAWLIPAIAVLLALALVFGIIFGLHVLRPPQGVPVQHQHNGPGRAGCPPWSTTPDSQLPSGSARMSNATTGWFAGALRTTDGGSHWRDVSPAQLRADAPDGTDPSAYPPVYADYFLDADHAWIARSYESTTSCFDHESVFLTSDGGRTWSKSRPILAGVRADSRMQLLLDFIDSNHGWLMVMASGRLAPDYFLYSTNDGGLDWRQVAQLPSLPSFCGLTFISLSTGFLSDCINTGSPYAILTATRDGGKTWAPVRLPQLLGSEFTTTAPVFIDEANGVEEVVTQIYSGNTITGADYLAVTSDGGQTWRAVAHGPPGFVRAYAFLDPRHFWSLRADDKAGTAFVYFSSDGGLTWTLLASGLAYQDWATMQFVDPENGFVMGTSLTSGPGPTPLVLVTHDGGRAWAQITPQIS